eukprot:m.15109 g.15109  ORF g.15109 m.15109 type:complete len:292 (+) comp6513_c0_seq2:396-1271(+)
MKLAVFLLVATAVLAVGVDARRKTLSKILQKNWAWIATEMDRFNLLDDMDNSANDFTVYLPRDSNLYANSPYNSLSDTDKERYLRYSISPATYDPNFISEFNQFETLDSEDITVQKSRQLSVDGIKVKSINRGNNGLIYVLRAPLVPSWLTYDAQPNLAELVGILRKTNAYDLFLSAQTTVKTSVLNQAGPYTVFAPEKNVVTMVLDSPLLDGLSTPEIDDIIDGQIVAGTIMLDDLFHGQTLTTLAGTTLTITKVGSDYFINDNVKINRRYTDKTATNGVIHVVNGFLGF